MTLRPALWIRPWTTHLWGCSAPGQVDFPPPPSGGRETWYDLYVMIPTQICKPMLPSCCREKAWLPTTAYLRAWAHIGRSNRRRRAAHAHVRRGGEKTVLHVFSFFKALICYFLAPDVPPAEPVCFAYVTNNQQYLMLSCSWDGGAPKALVWWEGPGGQSKGGKENSNILILRYGTAHSGLPYTCHAKHPLLVQTKTCRLTLGQCTWFHTLLTAYVLLIHSFPLLEAPVLLTQRRVVSVFEGDDVQLTCNLRASYLPANEITWFNNQGKDVQGTSKYTVLRASAWTNLTVRDVHETLDSGEYRCSTSNAVGGTEINITLQVKSKAVVNQKT